MSELVSWLLRGPPWVQYRTRIDLLGQTENASEVQAAREAILAHRQIQDLVSELQEWPGQILKSHKDAKHPLHKLTFLADLGLRSSDIGVQRIVDRILEHQSSEGPFQVLVNIPTRYGGTGEDQWAWMLCDAPLLIYALAKLGYDEDPRVKAAVDHLLGLIRDNGWPCSVSPDLGRFRGPGSKGDPCPYANLVMLKVLSQLPGFGDHEVCKIGAETLLNLWEQRKARRPYLFAMGTGFSKLKAHLIWYDILHVLDVLTQYSWLKKDDRLQEMVEIVRSKADERGRFTPESIWRAWKDWDFGQKREPSPWLTLLVRRMLNRLDD